MATQTMAHGNVEMFLGDNGVREADRLWETQAKHWATDRVALYFESELDWPDLLAGLRERFVAEWPTNLCEEGGLRDWTYALAQEFCAFHLWEARAKHGAARVVSFFFREEFDRDDVLSDVRERFVEKLHTLRGNPQDLATLRAWTREVARSVCNTKLDRRKAERDATEPFDEEQHYAESFGDPEEEYRKSCQLKAVEVVREEMLGLNPTQRDALVGVYLDGKQGVEVARQLEVLPSTVSHALESGLDKLGKLLKKRAMEDKEFLRAWVDGGCSESDVLSELKWYDSLPPPP